MWGVALSILCTAFALFFVYRITENLYGARAARASTLALAFFPTAFFLNAVYTEALFLVLTAGAVWAARVRGNLWLAGIFGALAAATRNLGVLLLVPLFFAFTGLRTEIGLLNDWTSWLACAGIIAVAVAGKLGGSMVAARFTGMSWGDSFALGALMNTRGLVELIVLNLGYDLKILSPRIFAMLVLMALVTTFMTGPLLHLRQVLGRRREGLVMSEVGNQRPV